MTVGSLLEFIQLVHKHNGEEVVKKFLDFLRWTVRVDSSAAKELAVSQLEVVRVALAGTPTLGSVLPLKPSPNLLPAAAEWADASSPRSPTPRAQGTPPSRL